MNPKEHLEQHEEFLEEFFGEKCPDFDEKCLVCQLWWNLEEMKEALSD